MTQRIFIIGANSAIAKAVARQYAVHGAKFCLLARDAEKLKQLADDLKTRGAQHIELIIADVNALEQHAAHLEKACNSLGALDIVLLAHGTLPEQKDCEQSAQKTLEAIQTNGVSVISFMSMIANVLEQQGQGSLAVISSVAGDRGRQSNYTYGAAKALVSTFAEGMIGRFTKSAVHVLLIKPGFVDTPMTAALAKGALWAQPEQVATAIVNALNKKKDILYVPFFWWFILLVIKNIPHFIFKKLAL